MRVTLGVDLAKRCRTPTLGRDRGVGRRFDGCGIVPDVLASLALSQTFL
jgi:hypothetical protein